MKCELKWILYTKKMTQGELARRIGMTDTTLSNIVRGNDLKLSTALKIAKELGVPVEEIWR